MMQMSYICQNHAPESIQQKFEWLCGYVVGRTVRLISPYGRHDWQTNALIYRWLTFGRDNKLGDDWERGYNRGTWGFSNIPERKCACQPKNTNPNIACI